MQQSDQNKYEKFSCKICLDVANEPVITPCGHLYCWQCIYEWAQQKSTCPYCNNSINIDKLIPIYTSEQEKQQDRPKRPQPKREQPNQNQNNHSNSSFFFNYGIFPGFQFSTTNSNFSFFIGGLPLGFYLFQLLLATINTNVLNRIQIFYNGSFYHRQNQMKQIQIEIIYVSVLILGLLFIRLIQKIIKENN